MKRKYIHYGGAFDEDKFVPIKNISSFNKPHGGFWASPVDTQWGWFDWCKSERFCEETLINPFVFELKDGANVLEIKHSSDVPKLPIQNQDEVARIVKPIDYEALLGQGIDAIEFSMAQDYDGLYFAMYGWDCDSLLVLNPDIIVPTE